MSSIFGPIFDGSVLTRAVLAHLKNWYPTYIHEIELQRGYTPLQIPPPRTYVERWRFDSYPDDQIPIVIAVCPGMATPPLASGDGTMGGWWSLGVGVIAAANTEDNSERLAKIYGAAARTILGQKSFITDDWEFNGVEIMDESYEDVPDFEQARTMRAAQIICRVRVENMMNVLAGPAYPDPPAGTQPGSTWPDVETVYTDVERMEEQ
jgi:hypothetical protein